MTTYRIFGLRIKSDFDLRLLPTVSEPGDADVMIRRGEVSAHGIESPRLTRALTQVADDCVWFDVPDIARFWIEEGREVLVHPYREADERSILLHLLGSALGAVLHQRGLLALHANAVLVGGGVVLFAGASGAGKSTAAAAMLERGFEVLADDVSAINAAGEFVGGIPRLKLWKDVLGLLDTPLEGLEQIRPQVDKYHLPLNSAGEEQARIPVKALYVIKTANELEPDHFDLNHLEGTAKFKTLRKQTYRANFMRGLGLKPQHMKLCATLAARTPIAHIVRPTARFNAPELVGCVLEDLRVLGLYETADGGR
jgi:hypothetical protein